MTTATPATKPKKDLRKRCGVCRKKFTPSHASQKYHPECAVAKKTSTRIPRKPKLLPMTNPLIEVIVRAARYAGTAEVFEGNTVAQLHELRALIKLRREFSQTAGYDDNGRSYTGHLSHIYPVRGGRGIGKFIPSNLVLSDGGYNRGLGATHLGCGDFIAAHEQKSKYRVYESHTNGEVMALIIECIGRSTWQAFAKEAKLQPSGHQLLLDALSKLLDYDNPEHFDHIRAYRDKNTSPQTLRKIHEAITGQTAFLPDVKRCTLVELVVHELERMSKYRPALSEVHAGLVEAIAVFRGVNGRRPFEFLGGEYHKFMDILHGDDVDMVFVQGVIERCHVKPVYQPRLPHVPKFIAPTRIPTSEQQIKLERRVARIAARHLPDLEFNCVYPMHQEASDWDVPF